jgi:hypothetical protein
MSQSPRKQYSPWDNSTTTYGINIEQTPEIQRRIKVQLDDNYPGTANQRASQNVVSDIVLSGIRREYSFGIASDGDDRLHINAPHPGYFKRDPLARRLAFESAIRDLADTVSNFKLLTMMLSKDSHYDLILFNVKLGYPDGSRYKLLVSGSGFAARNHR